MHKKAKKTTKTSRNQWQPVPAGSYCYAQGFATWRVPLTPEQSCEDASLLDVSGVSATLANGQCLVRLSDVVCFQDLYSLAEPINVVATPLRGAPFFVTMTYSLVYSGAYAVDVNITFFAWNVDGTAAPNVPFDWRCRTVFEAIIL